MHKSPLVNIKVASPCNMEWRWMSGTDHVRYCRQCNLNVYNLSALSRREVEELILRNEGRLCVRFYLRADGTILTENCPVGLRAIKKKLARTRAHILGALMSFLGFFSLFSGSKFLTQRIACSEVVGGASLPFEQKSESYIREKARFRIDPIYPGNGKRQIQGEAIVKVNISIKGDVVWAEFVEGNPVFKEIAEEAARQWRFEPIIIDGVPTNIGSQLTFHFGR